ncbi:hypothetical protein HYT02_00760 [Candidatus Gottesmanbacteria bacterium]|nr:hypothetical protein [Candidatus Gottesmanbacteria bacterium]
MDEEEIEIKEQNLKSSPKAKKSSITLNEAVEFGEYNPQFLANFPEWHTLSIHIQWQLIRKALDMRRRQLITQYAELNNVLDLRKKPYIHQAIKNVQRQLGELDRDREDLYVEYSNKF